ncbi:hypothetical protein BDN72DRAFT_898940 [Pluteus cervinus]|uniref:Uncharacterized protein n=1 Tax=Pluteus cervinus TaxID=181527 RepID=A0ACD3APM4_9AGAR|nr:hypothetical protein BDN72DRAFT_898940 [Pluteus cervinus]
MIADAPSSLLRLLWASQILAHYPTTSMFLYHQGGCSHTVRVGALDNPDKNTPFSFDFGFIHRIPWPDISQILTSLPVHHITTLMLITPDVSLDDWTHRLGQFVHLECLVLEEELTVQSFIQFMISSKPNDTTVANLEVGCTLPFRSLRKLRLCGYYFEMDKDQIHEDILAFCSILGLRRAFGLPLEELLIPEDAPDIYISSL